jgi:hypothetical protein
MGNFDRHILPLLGDRSLDQISPADIARLKASLRAHAVTFNRCRALLSHMLNTARRWRVLPPGRVNPCAYVGPYPEARRDRRLTTEEATRVGAAMLKEEPRSPVAVAAIRAVMATGAQPSALLTLRLAGGVYAFPGRRDEQPLTIFGLEAAWDRIRKAARLPDVRVCDLRRQRIVL